MNTRLTCINFLVAFRIIDFTFNNINVSFQRSSTYLGFFFDSNSKQFSVRVITDPLQLEFVIFAVKKLHMYVNGRALVNLVYHIKSLLIFA